MTPLSVLFNILRQTNYLELFGFISASYHGSLIYLMLQLHGAIYPPDSFVMMLPYCAKLKAIRYESTSLNRIVADKSHRVIVA